MEESQYPSFLRRSVLAGIGVTVLGNTVRGASVDPSPPTVRQVDENPLLANESLELEFDRETGGITNMRHPPSGTDLLVDGGSENVWKGVLYTEEYDYAEIYTGRATLTDISTTMSSGRVGVELTWESPEVKAQGDDGDDIVDTMDATVTIRVELNEGEPFARWNGRIENDGEWSVKEFHYPFVDGIAPLPGDGRDALAIPTRLGRLYRDPVTEVDGTVGAEYPSGSATMQFSAYTGPTVGIYCDARDTGGRMKRFEWGSDGSTLSYSTAHTFSQEASTIEPEYETTFGVLRGNWYDAVDRYVDWLNRDGWLSEQPSRIPEWLREHQLMYRSRTHQRSQWGQSGSSSFESSAEHTVAYREYLDVPLIHHETGWQKNGYPGIGDWLPPNEGAESLSAMIGNLEDNGVPTTAFFNPTFLWEGSDTFGRDQDTVESWIMAGGDGNHRFYEERGEKLYQLDLSVSSLQDRVVDTASALAQLGVRGIQLDGLPWSATLACYRADHDHPVGPGRWYPNAVRTLFRRVQKEITDIDEGAVLGGEGASDYMLPYQTMVNSRDCRAELDGGSAGAGIAEPVPMLQYGLGDRFLVHHQNGEGPIQGQAAEEPYIRLILTRMLLWSGVPEFTLEGQPGRPELFEDLVEFLGEIGRARTTYAERFLVSGTMLRPPSIESERVEVASPRGEPVTARTRGQAFRSDNDEVAVVLANPTDQVEETDLYLTNQQFEIPSDGLVYRLVDGEYQRIEEDENGTVPLAVSPASVEIVVTAPSNSDREDALTAIIEAQARIDDEESDRLMKAKRAFEEGSFNSAIDIASSIGESTEAPSDTTNGSESQTSTNEETPGFTAVHGIGALGLGALKWLWGTDEDE